MWEYILNGHTKFLGEVYIGNELEIEHTVLDKKEGTFEKYGRLWFNFEDQTWCDCSR